MLHFERRKDMNVNFTFSEQEKQTMTDAFNILDESIRLLGLSLPNRTISEEENENTEKMWRDLSTSLSTIRAFVFCNTNDRKERSRQ
jgi:hypothetical protein